MNIRLILLISILLPLSMYSQNLKKGFKSLADGKMTDAAIVFNQAKDDMGMKSAAYYGLAKIESTKKRTGYDLFKAYEYITKADKFSSSMDPKVVGKISDYYSPEKVKAERKRIDDALFASVKEKKKLSDVDRFLKECEDSDHFLEMLEFKATMEYAKVCEYDTEKDYLEFIDRFPGAKEVDDAKRRIGILAWTKAKEENSIESYSLFIKEYPEAEQLDSAKSLLIDMEYQKAILVNTDAAFSSFINKYPDTEQAKNLEVKREKLAYDKAIAFDAFVVYENFINEFPQSKYISEISARRDSLAFLDAKKLNTEAAYIKFVNTYPNAKEVPLAMELLGSMSFSQAELAYMRKISNIRNRHIKSYKAFRINAEDSSQVLIEEQALYDTLGHQLRFMLQPSQGLKTVIEREFDAEGKTKIKEKVFVNEKLQKESVFSYSNQGLIKTESVILYFDRGKYPAEYISIYEYDSTRNLIAKRDSAIMDSSIVATHKYQYNSQGLLVLEDIDYADTTNTSTTYKYDANKHLVEKSTSNAEGKVLEVVSYTYDKQGRKISMKKFNAAGVVNHTYTYGENGIIEMEDIEVKSSEEHFRLSYQYEFYD